MKNFTPDERAADANIENTRRRAKPDTGILWGICRRTYKSRGNRRECGAACGAEGETEEGTGRYKERKIWTECHARGRGKTLSTIENPKVLTVFSVGTLGFSIVLSVHATQYHKKYGEDAELSPEWKRHALPCPRRKILCRMLNSQTLAKFFEDFDVFLAQLAFSIGRAVQYKYIVIGRSTAIKFLQFID